MDTSVLVSAVDMANTVVNTAEIEVTVTVTLDPPAMLDGRFVRLVRSIELLGNEVTIKKAVEVLVPLGESMLSSGQVKVALQLCCPVRLPA